jgi:hypothetical protein
MGTPSDDGKTIKVTPIKQAKEEKKEGDKAEFSELLAATGELTR